MGAEDEFVEGWGSWRVKIRHTGRHCSQSLAKYANNLLSSLSKVADTAL